MVAGGGCGSRGTVQKGRGGEARGGHSGGLLVGGLQREGAGSGHRGGVVAKAAPQIAVAEGAARGVAAGVAAGPRGTAQHDGGRGGQGIRAPGVESPLNARA